MANLIIKPSAGGDLKLQDEGSTDAITISTTGNTTLAGTANNLGTVTAGNINVGSVAMKSSDGSVTAMTCDSTGRIAQPAKPSFKALLTGSNHTVGNNNIVPFNTVSVGNNRSWNIGGHFNTSTSKFTCPVAGLYWFNFQCYSNDSGNQYWLTEIYNMTEAQTIARTMRQAVNGFGMDDVWSTVGLAKCSANDQIYCRNSSAADRVVYGVGTTTTSYFEGYFVG